MRLYNLRDMMRPKIGFPGGAAFLGFPTSSSNGVAVVPSALVGVSSTSRSKDLAIVFLMFILNSGNSQSVDLPVVQSALDQKLAAKADVYRDYAAADQLFLSTSYDGAPIQIDGTMPAELALDLTYELIGRADVLAVFDDALFRIILRESEAYFSGGVSLQQAVKRIQSKTDIYLSEQYG